MIVYNSENSIRNTMPFCRPLFCHRSLVKYTSPLTVVSEPVMSSGVTNRGVSCPPWQAICKNWAPFS